MSTANILKPIAEPQIIEGSYTTDQHRRMFDLVRRTGPHTLILSQHFKSPDEVVATTSGSLPEGMKATWDMFLSPVFRGYFAQGHTCLHPEIEDCFYNPKFLDLVRGYWKAEYARPESMLFNLQGPCGGAGAPHIDATRFRGLSFQTTPIWLMNMMTKSGLFKRWQAKKAQVIAWYYQGKVGGGFNYWPDGPQSEPKQLHAPMWGRAVVVENEMMYHTAQANGPSAMRRPAGLAINSVIGADPGSGDGWQITTDGEVIQKIPIEEMRFLVHWGADIFMDYQELKVTLDHTDDIDHERIFDIFIADLRERGETFQLPSDPLTDQVFIRLLTLVYDPGLPGIFPPEPDEDLIAAE
ncbi:MAG TPA: hypothetical protein VL899_12325 [Alphaproteobacteria bacterium]|jgi:hypothetical protein|nr:hypothetical protein [Alphaproteobacteria bacterium]